MHNMIKNDKTDLLLPNLDCLLRGLLGAAVSLQGLDDGEFPGVARPVLQDSLAPDPDPRPCLGHLACATAREEGQAWNESYFGFLICLIKRICRQHRMYFLALEVGFACFCSFAFLN